MEDKQFTLIMQGLNEIKDSQVRLEERQIKIEERQAGIEERLAKLERRIAYDEEQQENHHAFAIQEIRELQKRIEEQSAIIENQAAINGSTVAALNKIMQKKFSEIERQLNGIQDDLRTISVLLQINKEQHEEYDRILNIKR